MELNNEQYAILIKWIERNFIPSDKFCHKYSSYSIAHVFQYHPEGFYVGNENIKKAMVECGFKVFDEQDINWDFNISLESPAFTERYPGYPLA